MAVKYATVKDEPIKDLLGNINSGLIQRLLERQYAGDASKVPTVDYLSQATITTPTEIQSTKEGKNVVYNLTANLPDVNEWLETLAGPKLTWLRALLLTPTLVQGTSYVDNPMRRLLAPRAGQKVVVSSDGSVPSSLTIFGAARSYGKHDAAFKAVEITFTASSSTIGVTIFEERRGSSLPLQLQFQYKPSMGYAPIHEVAIGRNTRIKQFYWKLWYGDNETLPGIDIREKFVGPEVVIDAAAVEEFCAVVGNQTEAFKPAHSENLSVPMDFAIVTGWQVRYFFSTLHAFSSHHFAGHHEIYLPCVHRW